jgi:hypothetical protein
MRHLLSWMVGVCLATALSACGGPCDDYCEGVMSCGEEQLKDGGCRFADEEEALDECVSACEEALDEVSDDERDAAEDCFDCLNEEGSDDLWCDGDELEDTATDACKDACDNDDAEDGFEEFAEEFGDEWSPEVEGCF